MIPVIMYVTRKYSVLSGMILQSALDSIESYFGCSSNGQCNCSKLILRYEGSAHLVAALDSIED